MGKRKLLTLLVSICLVLSLAAVPFMSACEEEEGPPGEQEEEEEEEEEEGEPMTLRIGSLIGLTGWASGGTTVLAEGAQLAAEWINEQGGITINGQQYLIELVEVDDECTAEGASSGAIKLVEGEGVKHIVFGGPMPQLTIAAGSVTEPAGVLRCTNWVTNIPGEFGPDTPYTFIGHPGTYHWMEGAIKLLSEDYPEVETIVLMMMDDGSIVHMEQQCKAICAKYGISTTAVIPVAQDAVDFVPIATQAVDEDPDAICIVNGWPFIFGSILKAAREMNWDKPIVVSSTSAYDVLDVAGPDASTNCICVGISRYDWPEMTTLIKEIGERAVEKYGYFYMYHVVGFQTLWAMTQAMEAAQSLEPDVIIDVWEQMDTIETVYGTGSMGGLETYGINHSLSCPVPVEKLENGEGYFAAWSDVFIP